MINQCLINQMSSENKANNISATTPTVVKSTIDSSEKSKKSTMTSSAKEFIPKQKLSIDKSSNTFKTEIDILPDEQKQAGDYLYSDAGYESQFSCGNINECALNENENCLSGDLYVTNCNQTAPIRPNSLNMNSSNLCESNVYQTVTLQNPPIYTMDPNINSYYSCIAANPETINSVNYMANPVMTTASPVIVQHSSTQNLNLFQQFHNSGGSSPHSYQSVSPPILNNSTFTVPSTNNVSNTSMGGEHYVMVHVNLGETFSIRVGDQIQNISGPATVRMVSNSGPPTPMPMQVPPGHMVQQIVDENGILTHVILSPLHQPTQCLGPHVPHIHSTNSQSQFYTANQTNPTIPIYTNNYPLYTNGTNISQSINVNNHHLSNGQGNSSVTTNNENSRSNNGFQHSAEKSTNPRLDRVSKDRSQTAPDYSSSQNNTRFSDSKIRSIKHRTHQYHHSSQIDESQTYYPKNVSPSTDFTYNHDKPTNNSSLSPFGRDDAIHDAYTSSYTTSHSHYSKYRKKRPYSNSASANPKHHFMPDTNISPNSSADEVGTILTDEEKKAITDVLNTIDKPEVSEIEARSALIHIISPPIPDNCVATINSLEFQLHFAERNPESRYNCVFYGQAVEISLQDLKPATDYYVKVCAFYENITGSMSAANKFTTLPAEPNQPKLVQLQSKTRNSLQVKWNAPIENGSRITEFVLEYCRVDCNVDNYMEAYRGNAKTYKITKLKPSTEYLIRLSAINNHGQSPWSEPLSVLTSGTAPLPPDSPSLARADIGGLLLTWRKRPTDETFCLEMMDEATGYGFITVFNGPEVEHYVENLRRNTSYRFHLAASNQDGRSKWSDVVTHSTKPDLPSPPQKLHVRGKVHSTNFVLVWNEPEDDGGLPVTSYKLELDVNSVYENQNKNTNDPFDNESDRDWVIFYEGIEREYHCKNLTPGNVVLARVSAKSSVGGWGVPCNPVTINLAPMPPSQMLPPRKDLGNKTKGVLAAGGINLSWEKPESDGGSAITNYELCQWLLRSKSKLTSTDSTNTNVVIEEYLEETEEQVVYSGPQLYCQISGLIPGALYRYRIRATNKAGNGKWSNSMDATSGHGAPEAPSEAPSVICKSAHSAIISWKIPDQTNGAKITEYRLESKLKSDSTSDFQLIYCGPQLTYNVKNLLPDTCYRYRVQAVNRTGVSLFSPICDVTTPASVPGQITNLRTGTVNMQSIQLFWKEPASHGSAILNYNIEVTCCNSIQLPTVTNNYNSSSQDPFILLSESTDKIITDLLPDTIYKFRVQAVNGVGSGPFCPTIKSSTLSPPPSPPRLECLNIQSNSIKLRWHNDMSARQYYINRIMGVSQTGDKSLSNNSTDLTITQYLLQMSRQSDTGWSTVYTGTLQFHKLGKLLESTVYYFRIMASNEIGDGDFSDPFKVVTEKAAPPVVRAPKVSEITPDSCFIEWSALRSMNQDPIVYILQLLTISEKDCDYRQVYRGSDTSCRISNLLPGTEYVTRVCAVRLCSPSTITKERDDDSLVVGRRNDQEIDKSVIRQKGNSSPVTELLGPFSKSVPFTTFTSNNQRVNYGNISSAGSANLSHSEKHQFTAGLARHSSKLFQLPSWFTYFRDSIGPLTDTHYIILFLVIFSIIVIFIAKFIQTYLK